MMFEGALRLQRGLGSLADDVFDVLVIGGGVLGASIARDAAQRGLRTALIEAEDFASGASWNSLKTVHGGLRYLQQADLARVRESIRERSTWLRVAPHLVAPLPVVVPTYRHELRGRTAMRAALAVNDLFSWDRNRDAPPDRQIPSARALSRRETVELVPELDRRTLTGGVMFYDAQAYSTERLVLAVVVGAAGAGATVANHVTMVGPTARRGGLIEIGVEDRLSRMRFTVRTRAVVNAAGAGSDAVATALLGRVATPASPPSVAVNLVFRRSLGHTVAFAARSNATGTGTPRGRELFVVPWRGQTMVGTGHYAYDGDPTAFDPTRDADRFMSEVSCALPTAGTTRDDVAVVHGGILPATTARPDGTAAVRRHPIIRDHADDGLPGAITVVSVKYTTARSLAEHVVDWLFRLRAQEPPACVTASTPLPGAPSGAFEEFATELVREAGGCIPSDVARHLAHSYGTDARRLTSAVLATPRLGDRVVPGAPVIRAQLVYARACESGVTVADLLHRRTELGPRGLDSPDATRIADETLKS